MSQLDELEVIGEYQSGMCASMFLTKHRDPTQSVHWLAGWDAGYPMRQQKNDRTDSYLEGIGLEKQRQVKLA